MYKIKQALENTIEVKKSVFITTLLPIQKEEEIKAYLQEIKQKYPDATHHCYAYILEGKNHFSDDKEPSGTAGIPILNVLEKNQLDHILCVVTRYFGGILLGSGGLVRSYTKSTTEALKKAEMTPLLKSVIVLLTFPYSLEKKIELLLKNIDILTKKYQEKITFQIVIDEIRWKELKEQLKYLDVTIEIEKSGYF